MIERIYFCNLCRDRHKPDDGSLFALIWTGGGLHVSASGQRIAEHHICRDCFVAICESNVLLCGETQESAAGAG